MSRKNLSLDELAAACYEERPAQAAQRPEKRKQPKKQPERVFTPKRSSPPPPPVCWRCGKPARPDGPSCLQCLAHIEARGRKLRALFEAAERRRERDAP